jgi:HD-GYP domain-containing protein (c-di-GMP phosphodiesterase class II)
MVLASPIPHPTQPGVSLLRAGYKLEAKVLSQLPRYGIKSAWIRHPGFDFLDTKLNAAIPEARVRVYHQVKTSFAGIAARTTGSFNIKEYEELVGNLIIELIADPKHAVWAERILDDPKELFAHSSNVSYLSLIIGLKLKSYIARERRYVSPTDAQDLTNLGIGAMLHDIGKLGWESEKRSLHHFQEHDDEKQYRNHPERGYTALQGRLEATASAIVLHHHQQWDGKGFPIPQPTHKERQPKTFEGRQIHIFPRIAAVANTLDALIGLSNSSGRPLAAALASIQSPTFKDHFDPVVLQAAMKCIPPFAIGSCVTLSDGRPAVVTDFNDNSPCQPKVRLLTSGSTPEDPHGEELDLSSSGMPHIKKDGKQDVEKFLYRLSPELAKRASVELDDESEAAANAEAELLWGAS